MDRLTATNILKSRALASKAGVIRNVAVTNVSFKNGQTGQPFLWEEGSSSAGEPYAIANFNAMNAYGKAKSIEEFKKRNYQEACNTNLSARVTLEQGKALEEAMYASISMRNTEIDVKDDEGNPTGETETALLIAKCVPNEATEASDAKAFDVDADIFTTEQEEFDSSKVGG